MSHSYNKRRSWQNPVQEQEEFTDDLAIAAAYAVPAAVVAPNPELYVQDNDNENGCDSNEIALESSSCESSTKDESGEVNNITETTKAMDDEQNSPEPQKEEGISDSVEDKDDENNDDNDNDDESEVDLTEQLKQMTGQEEAEEEIDTPNTARGPKTIHEIDVYHTKVPQLESILGTTLTVQQHLQLHDKQAQLAGKVQHFMVEERIVVVQSEVGLLLEEGNLLVLKVPSLPTEALAGRQGQDPGWIPLGKILEVFGPVSQPLYSIRLPEMIDNGDNAQSSKNNDADTQEEQMPPEDPWSPNGMWTQLLQESPSQQVYYIQGDAIFMDAQKIYLQSGRGCDASNVHDEEVMNPNEMYYSDDEQERQAKGRKKGKAKTGHGDRASSHPQQQWNGPPPPHLYPAHPPPQQYAMPHHHPTYPPPPTANGAPQGFYGGNGGPPPQFAPPMGYPPAQFQGYSAAPRYAPMQQQPPPPPPPPPPSSNNYQNNNNNPNDSDTIYYD